MPLNDYSAGKATHTHIDNTFLLADAKHQETKRATKSSVRFGCHLTRGFFKLIIDCGYSCRLQINMAANIIVVTLLRFLFEKAIPSIILRNWRMLSCPLVNKTMCNSSKQIARPCELQTLP